MAERVLKILYHHRTASRDGQSTHIEEMVGAMRALGHEVLVVAPAAADGGDGAPPSLFKRLKQMLPRAIYEMLEAGYSLVAYRRLVRAIRHFHPDAIYERYNLFQFAGVWAARKFRLPLALEVNVPYAVERDLYGGLSLKRWARWSEKYVWTRATHVLPVTGVLARHAIGEGVSPHRVVVIPNGVDPNAYAALPTADEAKERLGLTGRTIIGFTGFVREWDRLDRIVRWLAKYPGSCPPHLLVVGDGPARLEIEACAEELGISHAVSFTGVLPRADVPAVAMAFDIALQTALVPYASPLCLFEYLALGKAIVAPDQPNHLELLANGEDSILYDPRDDSSMERCIARLCEDATLRRELGANARQLIERRGLTWRNHAMTVCRLFEESSVVQARSVGARDEVPGPKAIAANPLSE